MAIITMTLYGAEGWTLTKADEKRMESAELWIYESVGLRAPPSLATQSETGPSYSDSLRLVLVAIFFNRFNGITETPSKSLRVGRYAIQNAL